MNNEKLVSTSLASHFKLSKEMCLTSQEEMDYICKVPYALTIGSLMYVTVFTRPDISHAMGVVRRYRNNPGKEN